MGFTKKIKAFLAISRAKIQIGTPPHPLLGIILGASGFIDIISVPALLYILLYFVLITFSCNINCLYDIEIDKKYKDHMSNGVEEIGKKNVKHILFVEVISAFILIGVLINQGLIITPVLALSGLVFGYIYSADLVRIKKRGILSPIPVIIGLYTLPVLGGWFLFSSSLPTYMIVFTLGYAFLNEGITLVNTCEDYREDISEGIKTWAHVLEMRTTSKMAFIFTLLGGLVAVIGVILKPMTLGWSFYNTYSSIAFIILGVLNTIFILKISQKIYSTSEKDDLEAACKKTAKNMPKWFIGTRYPLVLMALLLFL